YAGASDGTGKLTLTWAPPAGLADSADVAFPITASLAGGTASLSCVEHVKAQPHDSAISGTVTAHGGGGVGSVTLTLTRPDSTTATTATDGTGAYGFTGLGAGSYQVAMTTPGGYSAAGPSATTATVDGTGSATADFSLWPSPVVSG